MENNLNSKKTKLSKGEKYFWITIVILLLCYVLLYFFASNNISNEELRDDSPAIKSTPILYKIVMSDHVRENLKLVAPELVENMKQELKEVDKEVDKVFEQIFQHIKNNNVDAFLNFHYSVIGEYTELGAMATGTIAKTIQDKLLGADFAQKIKNAASQTDEQYLRAIKGHLSFIEDHAYQNISMDLNLDAISLLNNEIKKNISQQEGKIGILLSARLAPKVIALVSAKLAAKATAKIALKTGAKLTAKSASALMGASAGSACGPAIVICSPLLAIGAWFATDAAITTGDEILNREEFKAEIILLLNQQSLMLKTEYKQQYSQSLQRFSETIKKQMSELKIKEKVRVQDKVRIHDKVLKN